MGFAEAGQAEPEEKELIRFGVHGSLNEASAASRIPTVANKAVQKTRSSNQVEAPHKIGEYAFSGWHPTKKKRDVEACCCAFGSFTRGWLTALGKPAWPTTACPT